MQFHLGLTITWNKLSFLTGKFNGPQMNICIQNLMNLSWIAEPLFEIVWKIFLNCFVDINYEGLPFLMAILKINL